MADAVTQANGFIRMDCLQAMDDGDGIDLTDGVGEPRIELKEFAQFALQQAGDTLQIVLDAVMDFAHQRVAMMQEIFFSFFARRDLDMSDYHTGDFFKYRRYGKGEPPLLIRRMTRVIKVESAAPSDDSPRLAWQISR